MTEVRRRALAELRDAGVGRGDFLQGIAGTLELFHRSTLAFQADRRRGDRPSGRRVPAHRPGRVQAADRRADPGRHRHADGVRARPPRLRAGGRAGGNRRHPGVARSAKAPACCWRRTTTSASPTTSTQRQMEYLHHGDALVPRQQRFGQYTRSLMKALDVPVLNMWGFGPRVVRGHQPDRAADRLPRSRRAGLLDGRDHVQLPSASAALRTDR